MTPADRDVIIESCARELETSFPGHAWLNAACAAIRSMKRRPKPQTIVFTPAIPNKHGRNDLSRWKQHGGSLEKPEPPAPINPRSFQDGVLPRPPATYPELK
jgi:hypothetical protein